MSSNWCQIDVGIHVHHTSNIIAASYQWIISPIRPTVSIISLTELYKLGYALSASGSTHNTGLPRYPRETYRKIFNDAGLKSVDSYLFINPKYDLDIGTLLSKVCGFIKWSRWKIESVKKYLLLKWRISDHFPVKKIAPLRCWFNTGRRMPTTVASYLLRMFQ